MCSLDLEFCHCGKRKSQEITKEIMRSYQETINVCYRLGVKLKSHIKILQRESITTNDERTSARTWPRDNTLAVKLSSSVCKVLVNAETQLVFTYPEVSALPAFCPHSSGSYKSFITLVLAYKLTTVLMSDHDSNLHSGHAIIHNSSVALLCPVFSTLQYWNDFSDLRTTTSFSVY